MFFLKKLITAFLMPVPLAFLALFVGVLVMRTKRRGLGVALVWLSLLGLLLGGLDVTANALLRPLEQRHPALLVDGATPGARDAVARKVRYIAVLGSGHVADARYPALTQLDRGALARITEGLRLARLIPEAKLVLTGAAIIGSVAHGDVAARAAAELGLPRERLVIDTRPRDTGEESRVLAEIIGKAPFVLVTSASHQPRAVGLVKKLGMDPIPAPCDYRADEHAGVDLDDFFPSGENWSKLDRAWHEYLGMAAAKLLGRI